MIGIFKKIKKFFCVHEFKKIKSGVQFGYKYEIQKCKNCGYKYIISEKCEII